MRLSLFCSFWYSLAHLSHLALKLGFPFFVKLTAHFMHLEYFLPILAGRVVLKDVWVGSRVRSGLCFEH